MNARAVTQDWRRLADAVIRRRTELGMTQQDVQAAGGPATATVRNIEGAHQTSYRGVILSRLEKALGWRPGSVEAILASGEATLTQPSNPHSGDLRERVRSAFHSKTLGDLLVERGIRQRDELVISDEYEIWSDKFITDLLEADEFEDAFVNRWLSSYSNMRREIFEEVQRQKENREG